jgi:hypothetical protein
MTAVHPATRMAGKDQSPVTVKRRRLSGLNAFSGLQRPGGNCRTLAGSKYKNNKSETKKMTGKTHKGSA